MRRFSFNQGEQKEPCSALILSRISFLSTRSAFRAVSSWAICTLSCCSWICHFCSRDTSKALKGVMVRQVNQTFQNLSKLPSCSRPAEQLRVALLQQVLLKLQLTQLLLQLQKITEKSHDPEGSVSTGCWVSILLLQISVGQSVVHGPPEARWRLLVVREVTCNKSHFTFLSVNI